jgi:phosphatidylglycerol:prolipoprotein diacylglycerol transferase
MYPYIGVGLQTYPIMLGLTTVAGAFVAMAGARRSSVPLNVFLPLLLWCALTAFCGAKIYSILERGGVDSSVSIEFIYGYRYPGGVLGLLFGLVFHPRLVSRPLSFWLLADIFAPALAVGIAGARVGCFLVGCCFGAASDLFWGVRFPRPSTAWLVHVEDHLIASTDAFSLPVHPLQVYFAVLAGGIGLFLLWFQKRKRYCGEVAYLYMSLHGLGKFGLEFVRYERVPHVQLFSLVIGVAGTILLFRGMLRERRLSRSTLDQGAADAAPTIRPC